MSGEPDHIQALAFYGDACRPKAIQPLGSAGGFSGARFWRVTTDAGLLCLRRWPKEHPSVEGLEFIQAVLWYVAREGFDLVPLPLENRHRGGYVRQAGYLWELAPWMPGEADYCADPTLEKLRAAMSALAEFHMAAATFPLADRSPGPSPGIRRRLEQLQAWLAGDLARLAATLDQGTWPEMEPRGREILRLVPVAAPAVLELLQRAVRHQVALQPCICDIWHNHVLYEANKVTGLIDFGSMRPENVAADVARLLGSMADDEPTQWKAGLEYYRRLRPLSEAESDLVRAFDRSTVLMAGLNWLDWIYRQHRQFEHPLSVLERVDAILVRLQALAGQ